MKVKISPYPSRLTCNIFTDYMDKKYDYIWPKKESYTRYERFLESIEDFITDYIYNPINQKWLDKRQQKVKVHIDNYDVWSMDSTLAHIVVPMLELLQKNKHGAPNVDYEDVPKELIPTQEELDTLGVGDVDSLFFKRWDYVMDEMLFAFRFSRDDDFINYWDKDNRQVMEDMQTRGQNGLRLFGKYYFSLWD